jgi:Rrf2 family protein
MQNIKGFRPGIDEISREIEAPRFFTAKILQRLVRMGFVMSLKGKGGGFFFDKEKPDLTIKELITATEGNKIITGCGFGLKNCTPDNPCPMHERYAPIRDAIEDLVTSETIKSLALNYSKSTKSI